MRELILQRYPRSTVFWERSTVTTSPDAPFQWVLDPIDGTKNFISHGYLFGTLIALVHEQKALLGAIHQPILQDLLIGDRRHNLAKPAPLYAFGTVPPSKRPSS